MMRKQLWVINLTFDGYYNKNIQLYSSFDDLKNEIDKYKVYNSFTVYSINTISTIK